MPLEKEQPECHYCGDAGYVSRGLRPAANGEHVDQVVEQCRACNPERPVGIPLSRLSDSFENFDLARNPKLMEAVTQCQAVGVGQAWCALLYGSFGTGKTHLAIAALNKYGRGAFWKVPDLLDWLRQSYDFHYREAGGPGIEMALARFREMTGLLVLDDLGTEKRTEWAEEQLYRILDSRYDLRLPTILTTNQAFSMIDGRVKSRYAEGLVLCEGVDMRMA